MSFFFNITSRLLKRESKQNPDSRERIQKGDLSPTEAVSAPNTNDDRYIVLKRVLSLQFEEGDRSVYVHKDRSGRMFYVGIDRLNADFSGSLSTYLKTYIRSELGGFFTTEIIIQGLSSDAAAFIKDKVLELYSDQLLNTVNFHRKFDMEIFGKYDQAFKDYKRRLELGLELEKSDVQLAISEYEAAYDSYIEAMNHRNFDGSEMYLKARPPLPPTKLVDRISLCLKKTKEHQRLVDFADRYFMYFKGHQRTGGELKLMERLLEAQKKVVGPGGVQE